jgi:hypothetical protein
VEQAVHAVEVDERTEVGDVLDHALADLAGLDRLEEVAALLGALLLDELAAGEHDVLALDVDLEDLEIVGLADVLVEILGGLDVDVRRRHEGIDADRDNETALDLGLHAAGGHGAFRELCQDVIPVLLLLGLVEGDDRVAVLVLELLDEHLDGGADLQLADVDELGSRDDASDLPPMSTTTSFWRISVMVPGTMAPALSLSKDDCASSSCITELICGNRRTEALLHRPRSTGMIPPKRNRWVDGYTGRKAGGSVAATPAEPIAMPRTVRIAAAHNQRQALI